MTDRNFRNHQPIQIADMAEGFNVEVDEQVVVDLLTSRIGELAVARDERQVILSATETPLIAGRLGSVLRTEVSFHTGYSDDQDSRHTHALVTTWVTNDTQLAKDVRAALGTNKTTLQIRPYAIAEDKNQ